MKYVDKVEIHEYNLIESCDIQTFVERRTEKLNNISIFNNPVASNVSRIIEEKGLKQKAVADMANLSSQSLNDIINGRRILKVSETCALAKALDVDANELFKTD